jgi:hypothetical protein
MSDLRTRIAAALRTAERRVAGFIGYDEMADAVIAELNLTTPVEYLSVDGSRQNYMVAGHYTEDVNDETD